MTNTTTAQRRKFAALNDVPIDINGTPFLLKPDYKGGRKVIAYIKGQGAKGGISTGIDYEPRDLDRCSAEAEAALREKLSGGANDPAARKWSWRHVNEPLPPSSLKLWQLIEFHRRYTRSHSRRGDTSIIDMLDHSLERLYGEGYRQVSVEDFDQGALVAWLEFLQHQHVGKRGNKLSAKSV